MQRAERWQQQFVWWDGARMDLRCVFGSAHMPGFFQRVSSFVLAVAAHRIRQYDAQHPYSEARQAWSATLLARRLGRCLVRGSGTTSAAVCRSRT